MFRVVVEIKRTKTSCTSTHVTRSSHSTENTHIRRVIRVSNAFEYAFEHKIITIEKFSKPSKSSKSVASSSNRINLYEPEPERVEKEANSGQST